VLKLENNLNWTHKDVRDGNGGRPLRHHLMYLFDYG